VATSYELNHIEILDEDRNELAHWRDADLLLRMAAPHLLAALKGALFALDKNQEGSGPSKAKAIKQLARQSPSLNRASHERSEIHRDRGVEFATDSPLEGEGFELSVPRRLVTAADGVDAFVRRWVTAPSRRRYTSIGLLY